MLRVTAKTRVRLQIHGGMQLNVPNPPVHAGEERLAGAPSGRGQLPPPHADSPGGSGLDSLEETAGYESLPTFREFNQMEVKFRIHPDPIQGKMTSCPYGQSCCSAGTGDLPYRTDLSHIWPSGDGLSPQRGAQTPLSLALSLIDGEV